MWARIFLTIGYAAILGAWAYAEQKQGDLYSQGTYDALHSMAFGLAFAGLPVLVGFLVRRAWVFLALLGPLLSLGYLQVSGYVSPWHDGVDPLLSPPGFSLFFWFGVLLTIGVCLGVLWKHYRPALRNRLAAIRNG